MNKELRELLTNIQNKKEEARGLAKEGKIEEAKNMIEEINNMQARYEVESQLIEDEKGEIEVKNIVKNEKGNIETIAFMRSLMNKSLTEEMKAALRTSSDADGGYLVPTEVAGTIAEVKRQYKSVKDLIEVITVSSAKGTLPVEDSANASALVDFDEINDLTEQSPTFRSVTFALKNKGAVTPISNALLQDETAGLPTYVVRNFARKAIRTENTDVFALLKAGKATKAIADVAALKKSINKDLDPALLGTGACVITNQDGFHHLDQEKDANGAYILSPNPSNPDQKMFKGLPIFVFSNAELPTVSSNAPIFVGNFNEAVKFFDRGVYEVAVSKEAGFKANQTLMRVIERYDAKIGDVDAYINGQIDVTATL